MTHTERRLLLTMAKNLAAIYDENHNPERAKALGRLAAQIYRDEAAKLKQLKGATK